MIPKTEIFKVFFLVVMEDVLGNVHDNNPFKRALGLNPCFNGRCSRRRFE